MFDDPISVRYNWDAETMAAGMAAYRRQLLGGYAPTLFVIFMVFVLLVMVAIPGMIVLHPMTSEDLRRNMVIVASLAGAYWVWLVVGLRRRTFLKRQARRVLRSNPRLSTFIDWTIGPDHINLRTGTAEATLLWPAFVKVVEDPEGFLLFQSVQHYNWIPGRAFTSAKAIRQFADLAREKVPKYVARGECQFLAKPEPIGVDEL